MKLLDHFCFSNSFSKNEMIGKTEKKLIVNIIYNSFFFTKLLTKPIANSFLSLDLTLTLLACNGQFTTWYQCDICDISVNTSKTSCL